ncbi:hypothetical protein [Bradyrhizobium sp. 187]|jgi:hypothetical protein|uniref:DUF6894 family protein n=1 Tax=Bradyrhizobium sp. 187 TaxID=2782655 RepID=UPI001FFEF03E|nr:hypothetical protein [Bradyrhizobium sp. 187]UPJ74378.1 hypothetical protein IVB19_07490 [Bradyrhizobium sp. 187]
MHRYFFDMYDGHEVVPDEEGVEFASLDAVQDEAAHALADLARDEVQAARTGPCDLAVAVRDGDGPVLLAKFSFVIQRLH